jgi:Na+:H+ antiporter, NhaA family
MNTSKSSLPPDAWPRLARLAKSARRPLRRFFEIEASSGILLLAAAAFALACANSRWGGEYLAFWQAKAGISLGAFHFERSLEWVVNDGLMVIFFFVVGLEIRREIYAGELSEWRRAALPAAAAAGGMIAPALLYLGFASAGEARSGWGVPMATDIAFAVGVLALLGKRVPPALRVLLLALAVIDDLGAILVIALFYSGGVAYEGLIVAAAGLASVFVLRGLGVRRKFAYVPSGLVVWGGIYASGVHPTISGVVLGLVTPVRAWLGASGFAQGVREEIERLQEHPAHALSGHELAESREHMAHVGREAVSPAERLIELLHPWVAYLIMPLFALANAGVALQGVEWEPSASSVALGVAVGLVVGKPIGVLAACALTLRTGVATLPTGITFRHLLVLGVVAGIGFTMALFVAQLAFSSPKLLAAAKLGVLTGSGVAACAALLLGRLLLHAKTAEGAAQTEEEAEQSTTH